MASSGLHGDVVEDCCPVSVSDDEEDVYCGVAEHDSLGVKPRVQDTGRKCAKMGIKPRNPHQKNLNTFTLYTEDHQTGLENNSTHMGRKMVLATKDITDEMMEDGAYVVFDWDNTLKLYNKETRQLSCRVSHDFLLHLKRDRGCHLYIISAIRPSKMNLETILMEVEKLGLSDVFADDYEDCDQVDGVEDGPVVCGEYAQKGNIIICGYDKAETFLKLSPFGSKQGDKVMFFDDEEINIDNFSALVPNSTCYHCN